MEGPFLPKPISRQVKDREQCPYRFVSTLQSEKKEAGGPEPIQEARSREDLPKRHDGQQAGDPRLREGRDPVEPAVPVGTFRRRCARLFWPGGLARGGRRAGGRGRARGGSHGPAGRWFICALLTASSPVCCLRHVFPGLAEILGLTEILEAETPYLRRGTCASGRVHQDVCIRTCASRRMRRRGEAFLDSSARRF